MQSVQFVLRTVCPRLINPYDLSTPNQGSPYNLSPYGLSKANQSKKAVRTICLPYDLSADPWVFVNSGIEKNFQETSGCLDGCSFGLSQEGIGKGLGPGDLRCNGRSLRVRNKNRSSKSNL